MKKHSKAGLPVKVSNGVYKGRYFTVIDYLVNQFQGKPIEKLAKTHRVLLDPITQRGLPMDSDVVFGKLYPSLEFMCLHDSELQVKPDLKIIEGESDGKDSGATTDSGHSSTIEPGEPEPDGCPIPSDENVVPIKRKSRSKKPANSPTGSPVGGEVTGETPSDK